MNNQSGVSNSFQNIKDTTINTLDIVIANALLKGQDVVIPGFGYLELKLFPDRRTVLFKSANPQDLPSELYLEGLDEKDHFFILKMCISNPLEEGKVVSMPGLGIFRPLKREDGSFHVSFTPSSFLRQRLNEEKTENKQTIGNVKIEPELPTAKSEQELIVGTTEGLSSESEVICQESPIVEKSEVSEEKKQVLPDINAAEDNTSNKSRKKRSIVTPLANLKIQTSDADQNGIFQVNNDNNKRQEGNEDFYRNETPFEIIKTKRKNISGILLGVVCLIAIIVIIFTIFFQGKEKENTVANPQSESLNLVDLARKNYGNPAFWVYIYESNKDKLTSPVNIPQSVTLTIPDLSEYNIDIKDSLEIIRANIRSEDILEKYIENKNNN
ncbi:MAG: hypothetical protein LBP83_00060 [Dysgonamonadaceae bacterium]|jgi:nucleoid DNA-binding protein|nr:hypothetical protein [Dysgonamonadaceae bacterium]